MSGVRNRIGEDRWERGEGREEAQYYEQRWSKKEQFNTEQSDIITIHI